MNIEKNIPITRQPYRTDFWKDAISKMEINDSLSLDVDKFEIIIAMISLRQAAANVDPLMRFKSRRQETGYRVWRIK